MSGTIVPTGSTETRLRAIRQAAEEDELELLAHALAGLSPRFRDAPSPN